MVQTSQAVTTRLMKRFKTELDRTEGNSIMENTSEPTERTKAAFELWNNKVSLSFGNKTELGHEIQKYLKFFFQNQPGVKSD